VSESGPVDLGAEYEALRRGVGAHRLARDVLSVSGPDAAAYLQGQCSQDIDALAVGQALDSLLLAPEGKVVAFLRVLRIDEQAFALDVDAGFGERVQTRLTRFLLRSKVTVEPLDWACVALRGDPEQLRDATGYHVVAVEWGSWRGVDLLGPLDAATVPANAQWCGDDAWEACRIESGIPLMGRELDEGTIPAESGLVERSVSFTKGCYTGQELVARIDSRGNRVARRLCGLIVDGATEPTNLEGAELTTGEGRAVGWVTSATHCPGLAAVGALGYVHRSVEIGETVRIGDTPESRATLRSLPLV
jgi:folate-binding protein YgfZ